MAQKDDFDGSNLPGDYGLSNSTEQKHENRHEVKFNHEYFKSFDGIALLSHLAARTLQNLPSALPRDFQPLKPICECCLKNEGYYVVSSSFGAMSVRLCETCLNQNAEPLDNFFVAFDMFDSIDFNKDVLKMKAFKDGAYLCFDDIVKLWKERIKKVRPT